MNTETINDGQRGSTCFGTTSAVASRAVRLPSMGGAVPSSMGPPFSSGGIAYSNSPARPTPVNPLKPKRKPKWRKRSVRNEESELREESEPSVNTRSTLRSTGEKARLIGSQLVGASIYLIVKAFHLSVFVTVPYAVLNILGLWS